MKGTVNIYGVEYKYKTHYWEGQNVWTSGNRYLDLKYKKKGKFFYTKTELASTNYLYSIDNQYEEQNKIMDRFLSMSEPELRKEIITAICLKEHELQVEADEEKEKNTKTKSFKQRFN
jgi:hypothetical protein